jgi:hypothetical protein
VKTYVIYVPAVVQLYAPLRFKRKERHERKGRDGAIIFALLCAFFAAFAVNSGAFRFSLGYLLCEVSVFYVTMW